MSLLERLRNRRYDGNALIQDVLKTIDESHNYVKVRFTPEYVNLEYWVKEPEKMVTELNFYFSDYNLKNVKQPTSVEMRNYAFTHMALREHHCAYNDEAWHSYEFSEVVPCIYPKTR